MPRLSDTAPDVERRQFEIYRTMSVERKVQVLRDHFRMGRTLHAAGFTRRHPAATDREIQADWLFQLFGYVPPVTWPEDMRMAVSNADNWLPLRHVLATFRQMGLGFAVGGSWASSIHGEARMTNDADVSVEPFPVREDEFSGSFDADWYVSVDSVRQANRQRTSFNVLFTPAGFKVDVFVQKLRAFDKLLISRRVAHPLPGLSGDVIEVVSPEDCILLKLEWFRMGGEISDQQWRDILGVMKSQQSRLDSAYLDQWAASLGVADLLQRARGEAIIP
jgi:hypothetical protein